MINEKVLTKNNKFADNLNHIKQSNNYIENLNNNIEIPLENHN